MESTVVANGRGDGDAETARARTEHALVVALVTLRSVCLFQGLICTVGGRRTYRRPGLALAAFAAVAAESAWLVRRCWSRGSLDEAGPLLLDASFGLGGLVGLAAAMTPEQRTTWLNWAEPVTFGIASGAALALGEWSGPMLTAVLGTTHAATLREADESLVGSLVSATGNMSNYAVCYSATRTLVRRLRRSADEADQARRDAVERGERLAAERERNRQHRLLHDSALQTLEAIAAGLAGDVEAMRARARGEALRLRAALQDSERAQPTTPLAAALAELAIEFAADGLRVEVLTGQLQDDLPSDGSAAMRDATHEALRNVVKHAQVSTAIVRAAPARDGVELTVRDHGCGFDTAATRDGLGLQRSVFDRLHEIGGTAELWSQPGRGTRVTLWVPA